MSSKRLSTSLEQFNADLSRIVSAWQYHNRDFLSTIEEPQLPTRGALYLERLRLATLPKKQGVQGEHPANVNKDQS
jgi:hypothetical protein